MILLRYAILLFVLSLCTIPIVGASARSEDFLITKWTTEEGLPQNTVTSIVQTPDGFIWLGTFGGLARFDGVKFTVFDSTTIDSFRSNRVLSLCALSNGDLWVGTESGEIYVIHDGRLEEFHSGLDFRRGAVWAISEDVSGNLFVSSDSGIEAYRLEDERFVAGSGKLIVEGLAYGHFKDANGRVWGKVNRTLVLLDSEGYKPISSFGMDLPFETIYATFDPSGRLYVMASSTLGTFDQTRYREMLGLDYEVHKSGAALSFIDDRLWYQQTNELYEFAGNNVTVHDLGDYVRSGSRAIFRDREGNIWLATQADGLVKLTRKRITSIASREGRDLNGVFAVIEDKDKVIWYTGAKLTGISGDRSTVVYRVRGGDSLQPPQALAIDDTEGFWVGSINGLYRLESNELVPVKDVGGNILGLFFDREHHLWIGAEKGLTVKRGDGYSPVSYPDGSPIEKVVCIAQLADGSIWLATGHGAARVTGEGDVAQTVEGTEQYQVRDIVEDRNGAVWIGTYGGGILRIKNGVIATVTRANGLPNNFVSRIIIADSGHFWILSNFGIFSVAADQLDAVADGSLNLLSGAVFGAADGMKSSEANGGHQPAGILASDGRLWFPMISDLIALDTKPTSNHPPTVVIENAVGGNRSHPADAQVPIKFDTDELLTLEPDVRNVEIIYTALSFTNPDSVRFLAKLEGLDADWVDAGTRRRTFYGYLPPGDYRFLVRAISADGIPSETTASLRLRVAEHFWETRWFVFLLIAAAILVAAYLIWKRLRELKARQQRQAELARQVISAGELERKRIAKELHDGLSQNLLVIKNWALLARKNSRNQPGGSNEYLDKIAAAASESLDETRLIIENLGPQNLKRFGLTEAIHNVTEQIESAFGITFEKDIDNIDGLLDDDAELSVYRIVQEVLNNIVKHSESPRALIKVRRNDNGMTITIADFGTGFDPNLISSGQGLRSLNERAGILGGKVTVSSVIEKGTEVTINIPKQ